MDLVVCAGHPLATGKCEDVDSIPCRAGLRINSGSSGQQQQELEEQLGPSAAQYEDFHTIDWQRDLARDRMRHRLIVKRRGQGGLVELLVGFHDAWSGWLCVLLVGLAAGATAAVIDIGALWMKDLREGICPQAFWLNKEQCCWASNDTFFKGDDCKQWYRCVSARRTFTGGIPV
ncbi:H(+)/Cl(-) exchange transporter 3-like isoform X1 [Rhipicephalus microplus]|uniref:H(+)/Cl(-) exchange transporter 3-like isoform X1 n=1 Tax=Rhipicephalus microplus TaxID=6941 RepID=UPI003F6CD5FB